MSLKETTVYTFKKGSPAMESFVRSCRDTSQFVDECRPLRKLALIGDSVLALIFRIEFTNAAKYKWEEFSTNGNPRSSPLNQLLTTSNSFLANLYRHLTLPSNMVPMLRNQHERGTIIEAFIGAIFMDCECQFGKTMHVFFQMFGHQVDDYMRREFGFGLRYSY